MLTRACEGALSLISCRYRSLILFRFSSWTMIRDDRCTKLCTGTSKHRLSAATYLDLSTCPQASSLLEPA